MHYSSPIEEEILRDLRWVGTNRHRLESRMSLAVEFFSIIVFKTLALGR